MIPDRLLQILRTCESAETARFPPTEIFNEGWMLRLVLDAVQTLNIRNHPLAFCDGAAWYSEARLSSPFRPRARADRLGEGFTNADAVIGHFEFRVETKAGLRLLPGAKQFVVVEAKMFSNLSAGTKNAPTYNQAARNVACMAEAIFHSGRTVGEFDDLGFFILAPAPKRRRDEKLEVLVNPDTIRQAVIDRIAMYELQPRPEAEALREWEAAVFLPLLDRLARTQRIRVLTWEDSIEAIRDVDPAMGEELGRFYSRCLEFAPASVHSVGRVPGLF